MIDHRDCSCRSLRSMSTHNTTIDRRPHLLSYPIRQTWHLQGHVGVDRLMMCWSSLVDEFIHPSVLIIVLRVKCRLLRRESAFLRHLRYLRSLIDFVVAWLRKLSMAQGNAWLMSHSVCTERSIGRSGIICMDTWLSCIVRCKLARSGTSSTFVVVRIKICLELKLMSQRVKLSLDHFSFLLLGFQCNFKIISVSLDKNELFSSIC